MSRWVCSSGLIAAIALVIAGNSPFAQGQEKPFKIVGVGVGPTGLPLPEQPARSHWIVGTATHLGKHSGVGTVRTDTADFTNYPTITGEFGSGDPFIFVGANGDKLVTFYGRTDKGAEDPGTFTLIPVTDGSDGLYVAEFVAEFVAVPGLSTGKFKGVTGSWIMYAYTAPFVLGSSDPLLYWWEGDGKLTFKKKKN